MVSKIARFNKKKQQEMLLVVLVVVGFQFLCGSMQFSDIMYLSLVLAKWCSRFYRGFLNNYLFPNHFDSCEITSKYDTDLV